MPTLGADDWSLKEAADRIREVDDNNWWHDVEHRQWTAWRPFHPGLIDSTHMFNVEYEIDGKLVAMWSVDTRKETVQEVDLEKEEEAAGDVASKI